MKDASVGVRTTKANRESIGWSAGLRRSPPARRRAVWTAEPLSYFELAPVASVIVAVDLLMA